VLSKEIQRDPRSNQNSSFRMFFDKAFLSHDLGPRSRELLHSIDLPGIFRKMATSPDFDVMLIAKLTELSLRLEGMMLLTISQMVSL
jgi:hypothetical protein